MKFSFTVCGVLATSAVTGIEPEAGTMLQSTGALAVNAREASTGPSGPRFVTVAVKVVPVAAPTAMLKGAGAVFTAWRSAPPVTVTFTEADDVLLALTPSVTPAVVSEIVLETEML